MLRIYYVALEVLADMQPVVDEIKRKSPQMGDNLDRALTSVPAHVAEGSQARGRFNSYSNGAQEMTEAVGWIDAAVAKRLIARPELHRIERMQLVARTLSKCARG